MAGPTTSPHAVIAASNATQKRATKNLLRPGVSFGEYPFSSAYCPACGLTRARSGRCAFPMTAV